MVSARTRGAVKSTASCTTMSSKWSRSLTSGTRRFTAPPNTAVFATVTWWARSLTTVSTDGLAASRPKKCRVTRTMRLWRNAGRIDIG